MTLDRRLTPANKRVADPSLRSQWPGVTYVDPTPYTINWPLVDLMSSPEGHRDRQLLFGESVDVYEMHEGWAFIRAEKDGYVGYVPQSSLAQTPAPTHRVCATNSHIYRATDIKSPDIMRLSRGCLLHVLSLDDQFAYLADGFVPRQHVEPVTRIAEDPVAEAELYLGTPYLWGGNSAFGIDCSGLVQAALRACEMNCPGDSDLQETNLGSLIGEDEPLIRGDLLFWKGHVAIVVDEDRLIHANAHSMAVTYEQIDDAVARIQASGGGAVTSRKRIKEANDG